MMLGKRLMTTGVSRQWNEADVEAVGSGDFGVGSEGGNGFGRGRP